MQESLFSYKYNTTLIHKTPALLKIILLCFVSIRLFSQNNNIEIKNYFFQYGFYFFIGCILFFIGKINFTSIKKLLFIPIICSGIILISSIEFTNSIKFNFENSLKGLLYAVRLFVTSFVALIIFETTSIYQLENELDKIPLFKRFRISQTISLTILFIPLIFRNWTKIQNAIKARSVKNSKNIFIKINNLFQSFSTLLSYLLNTAENTRKAILNREKYLAK